jgi:ABC-2 type transport system ATP-binding protein
MIVTEGLTKRYGAVTALADLSLTVRQGEVFGLLGPNGSGKTTTIRLLLGLLRPTSGSASVAGHDCWSDSLEVRRLVTYLPGELRMFGSITGLAMLRFLSELRGGEALDRAVALAEQVMKLDLKRKVRTYSTGMKQKLALAQAFSDPVEILILDEPTSALDPSARAEVLALVRQARDVQKQTVIFSGHVLSEVEEVSDRVAIMSEGRLLHLEDLHERRALRMVLLRFAEGVPPVFPNDLELTVREWNGSTCLLEHRGRIGALLSWLSRSPIEDVAIGTDDLRSLYEQYHRPKPADSEIPSR